MIFGLRGGYRFLKYLAAGLDFMLLYNPISGSGVSGNKLDLGIGGFISGFYTIKRVLIKGKFSIGYGFEKINEKASGVQIMDIKYHGLAIGIEAGAGYMLLDWLSVGGVIGYYIPVFFKACGENECGDVEGDIPHNLYIGITTTMTFGKKD